MGGAGPPFPYFPFSPISECALFLIGGALMMPEHVFASIEEGFEERCVAPGCCNRASWLLLRNVAVMLCSRCYVYALQRMGIGEGSCEMCLKKYPLQRLPAGICVDCRSVMPLA